MFAIAEKSGAAVTSLWRGEWQVVAGFADGAVRAWDERAGARPVLRQHEHGARVLLAARRPDLRALVTACAAGLVRVDDARAHAPGRARATLHAPAPLAAADVHPLCDLIATGSVNQCISIYDLKGTPLNTIKSHEGFMAARIGPVSCLTFHPLRCALGMGSKDSTVSVYVSEARR
ncbi:regulatory-associated protein of mTOR-like [Aphomia sociella]